MAKLAVQNVIFQLSKAVGSKESEVQEFLDSDALKELLEAVQAMAGDSGVVVEILSDE